MGAGNFVGNGESKIPLTDRPPGGFVRRSPVRWLPSLKALTAELGCSGLRFRGPLSRGLFQFGREPFRFRPHSPRHSQLRATCDFLLPATSFHQLPALLSTPSYNFLLRWHPGPSARPAVLQRTPDRMITRSTNHSTRTGSCGLSTTPRKPPIPSSRLPGSFFCPTPSKPILPMLFSPSLYNLPRKRG